jgi:hypothetical protein
MTLSFRRSVRLEFEKEGGQQDLLAGSSEDRRLLTCSPMAGQG